MLTRTAFRDVGPTGRGAGAAAGFMLWTDADRDLLGEFYMSVPRPSNDDIAVALGRSVQAISTEANRMGLTEPGVQLRKCLPCEKQFWSWGIGNRICRRCERTVLLECA